MRRLVVTDFLTLDGVMEAPGMEEASTGRNAWALRSTDDELEAYNQQIVFDAEGILLGRRTYEIWAAFWPWAAGDEAFARRMNEMPKYVFSRTLRNASWANTTVLNGDLREAIQDLKAGGDGTILVYGSGELVADLVRNDLVDEYRFLVFPVILGSGKQLLRFEVETKFLRLTSARPFPAGAVLLTYEPATEAPTTPYMTDYAWTDEQARNLRAAQEVDRVLASVLFTDIVDSTGRAAELGDRRWRQLLDRHDEVARAEVTRWRGTYVKSTGDGVLATFDGPTRALRCALGLRQALADIGLPIRAAIHTGEVELRAGDIGGMAVHIASRALTEAGAGAVVVTRTVQELATGTDLAFRPLGTVELRGVPGQWELFEASSR
jgi:class 3 adenylate cyclase/dihydrofolate reductase